MMACHVPGGRRRSRDVPRNWSNRDVRKKSSVLLRKLESLNTNATCELLRSKNANDWRTNRDWRWNDKRSTVYDISYVNLHRQQ